MKRRFRRATLSLAWFLGVLGPVAFTVSPALAVDATAPITAANGVIACATCATESSPTQYGIPVWSTTQEFGVIATDADTTKALFSGGSSANPAYRAIADGDVPDTITVSNYLPKSAGSGQALTGQLFTDNLGIEFDESDTNPTCASGNFSIYADLSEAKLKKCTDGVATDLDTTSTSPNPVIFWTTETKVTANTSPYGSVGGALSTTEALMHTPSPGATYGNLRCNATHAPGGSGIKVWVSKNTCGSGATFSGSIPNVTLTAANTAVADTSNTIAPSAGECLAILYEKQGTTTTDAFVKCSLERTA